MYVLIFAYLQIRRILILQCSLLRVFVCARGPKAMIAFIITANCTRHYSLHLLHHDDSRKKVETLAVADSLCVTVA